MITYNRSAFGLNLIFRVHGSAVYRSVIPSLVAVACFFLIREYMDRTSREGELGHPYAIGVLLSSTTFLVVFRLNQGYSRYWEACTAVHHMASKWMDATIHMGVFHLQCDHYKDIKPPSYFEYPELNAMFLTRDRDRGYEPEDESIRTSIRDNLHQRNKGNKRMSLNPHRPKPVGRMSNAELHREVRSVTKSINYVKDEKKKQRLGVPPRPKISDFFKQELLAASEEKSIHFLDDRDENNSTTPFPLLGKPRLDGNWGPLFHDGKSTFVDPQNPENMEPAGFASLQGGRTPPLLLQELAHLCSLLVAVAYSTLRNDIDGAESPLDLYEPGSPWPEVDPDKDEWLKVVGIRKVIKNFMSFLGVGPSPEERTHYNSGRPFPVLGGVSDSEIRFLQMARGPYAKTQLCWGWLSEFCIREHLAGSTGNVGPPIISRVIQFLSDGMIYYNHARKIMFIPFPFVHAQLSVLFVIVMVPAVPFLMDQYTDNVITGAVLTFFTVMCLSGIHEVARELENPFRNVPNEIPLVTMMAHFNEALITMYAGYHPDHYWDGDRMMRKRAEARKQQQRQQQQQAQASKEMPAAQAPKEAPPQVPSKKAACCSGSSRTPEENCTDREEIVMLKRQLEEQAKMIERLASKINFDPVEETEKLEQLVQNGGHT